MKWLLILFLGIVIVPVLAQNTAINQTDYQKLENEIIALHDDHVRSDSLSLYYVMVTFVGSAIIAVVVAISQTKQSKKIKNITTEIQNMVKKQNKLIDDTKAVYAQQYVAWVQSIIISFEYMIDWYNTRYLDQPISEAREDTRRNLIDHYERELINWRPKVEVMELVKVFGEKIANEVWFNTTHMHAMEWQPNTDTGMALMIKEYQTRVKQAIGLKDIFLTFCDENMKIKDQNLKEMYEKIKATE